jgi:hypothetical protein
LSALAIGAPGGLAVGGAASAPATSGELDEIPLVPESVVLASTRSAAASGSVGAAGNEAPSEAVAGAIPLLSSSIAQQLDFGRSGSFMNAAAPAGAADDERRDHP